MLKKTGFLLIITILLTVSAALGAPETQKVGEVLFVRGRAWLIRDGEKSALASQSAVRGADIVKTGHSAQVSVRLEGGYVMSIRPRSEFMFDEPGAETETVSSGMLNVGVVHVKKRSRDAKKKKKKDYYYLQVQIPSAVAGVRGTDFAVAVSPAGKSLVAVKEGLVGVAEEGKVETTLKMRQKLEIPAEGKISEEKISDYFPEQYSVYQWFDVSRKRALNNVAEVARGLAVPIKDNILQAEKLLEDIIKLADKITEQARLAEKKRLRGQSALSKEHRSMVKKLFPLLVAKVRSFIRLDNRIHRRRRVLAWMLEQAAEPDSPVGPAAKKLIESHYSNLEKLSGRLEKLRARRRQVLSEKIPEMKRVARAIIR